MWRQSPPNTYWCRHSHLSTTFQPRQSTGTFLIELSKPSWKSAHSQVQVGQGGLWFDCVLQMSTTWSVLSIWINRMRRSYTQLLFMAVYDVNFSGYHFHLRTSDLACRHEEALAYLCIYAEGGLGENEPTLCFNKGERDVRSSALAIPTCVDHCCGHITGTMLYVQ